MTDVTASTVLILGIVVLGIGLVVPAETTETKYINGQVIEETNENSYKMPMIVVGGVFVALGGFAAMDTTPDDTQSAGSPDQDD